MADNIVEAVFAGRRSARTRALYQYDYGQILKPIGLELPPTYEVHFGASATGPTMTQLGNADGVAIPDVMLTTGASVYAYIYLHSGEDDGETVYSIVIPVIARGSITDEQPTPVEQSVITQAIAALNAGVETVEQIAEDIPEQIEDALTTAKESGDFDGPPGPPGNYTKPESGIPASDLAAGVIPDVSGFYTKPESGIPASDLASGVIPDVSGFYTKPSGGIPASDLAAGIATVTETVSGTTPTITAQANTRYICGEVASISITPPSSGICDIVFISGTTPAVLTVPSSVKWPAWFDPTSLDPSTTYELNIADGTLGAVMAWA